MLNQLGVILPARIKRPEKRPPSDRHLLDFFFSTNVFSGAITLNSISSWSKVFILVNETKIPKSQFLQLKFASARNEWTDDLKKFI